MLPGTNDTWELMEGLSHRAVMRYLKKRRGFEWPPHEKLDRAVVGQICGGLKFGRGNEDEDPCP